MTKTKGELHYLKELKKAQGKFKCSHKGKYNDCQMTTVVLKIADKYYMGIAECSLKDQFSRKIGRALALKRAMLDYKKGMYREVPEHLKFREDQKEGGETEVGPELAKKIKDAAESKKEYTEEEVFGENKQ